MSSKLYVTPACAPGRFQADMSNLTIWQPAKRRQMRQQLVGNRLMNYAIVGVVILLLLMAIFGPSSRRARFTRRTSTKPYCLRAANTGSALTTKDAMSSGA